MAGFAVSINGWIWVSTEDEYTIKVVNRTLGALVLHEITAHRIEQWKRERLSSRWRAQGQKGSNPVKPATVNRELDTLKSIFSKAVEWGVLLETRNGRMRRVPISSTLGAVLERLPKISPWVFSSPRSGEANTAPGVRHMLNRAVARAGLRIGDVTFTRCDTRR
jgi:hypothetical protein